MPPIRDIAVPQIESVLQKWLSMQTKAKYDDFSDQPEHERAELTALMLATIDRLAPPNSSYRKVLDNPPVLADGSYVAGFHKTLFGTLSALKSDYQSGNLQSIGELIRADVFTDFLEMADYLLQERYKDPAAVITGSVLEEHLRSLCDKSGVPVTRQDGTPKKAESMNTDLAAAAVYSKLDQKNVTAWLDLRNKAAHGKYSEYNDQQVALLIQSIRDFLTRVPA